MTPERLAELRQMLAAATPGEWRVAGSPGFFRTERGEIVGSTLPVDGLPTAPADAALIVALRNSASALLDAAERGARIEKAAREFKDAWASKSPDEPGLWLALDAALAAGRSA